MKIRCRTEIFDIHQVVPTAGKNHVYFCIGQMKYLVDQKENMFKLRGIYSIFVLFHTKL